MGRAKHIKPKERKIILNKRSNGDSNRNIASKNNIIF